MVRGLLLTSNLPQLQNLIKRDPVAYKEEFLQQWVHYTNVREIFRTNPDEHAQNFRELVTFISQVAPCYPTETKEFPSQLSGLLLNNYGSLSMDMRKSLVQNLVMLRNKGVISSIQLLSTLFPLLPRTSSSSLRTSIRDTILTDIRTANHRTKNHKLNKAVQIMLFDMVERGIDGEVLGNKTKKFWPTTDGAVHEGEEAMWAIIIVKELWKKSVWTDAKTVSIVAIGCLHPSIKVQGASIHFFLNSDEEEEDSEEEEVNMKGLYHKREVNKKTRSGEKKLQKQLKTAKKKQHKTQSTPNFSALQLLHDPQSFSEKLFDFLHNHERRFSLDHKILLMQLLSRVVGMHKLCVLGFYTYIIKYLAHKQLRVPSILVALAQSIHELTPPDALIPVVRKIAQEFVHPGVASEVIAVGLNSIREVCKRQPWAMETDLLEDLIEYRKSRDKSVTAAARGLLKLYREVNPEMLKRRERGKEAAINIAQSKFRPLPFGHSAEAAQDVEDLFLLERHLVQRHEEGHPTNKTDDDDDSAWEGWDEDSSSDSDTEGWIDVEDNDDNLVINESDDEAEGDKNTTSTLQAEDGEQVSRLATTKILTPADFALLNDLRAKENTKSSGNGSSQSKRKRADRRSDDRNESSIVSENDILGPRKKAKADYAERIASIQKGREGREKFGSQKGKQKKEVASSSTNREKARNKPIMMILSSGAVRSKKKASLQQKQQKLRAHIERAKKARR